ncbi:isoamylase early set domain-containing protein [Gelidibacter maritimus]|uniref:Isoamylase early set domain-containing protein n=1 Tax=Gelidibacter maritimus TaxID=2761487 RepID=A0A7W2R2Y7_9FLAO|nr:isoamylase early set domain-containing protein [Gelidibacter maritimus]MBA6152306.1 isoamylase early set domain-containing protein [Gelidibacter maritimus]
MAITKQYLKSKPICKVTFTVPAEDAKRVSVLGTFNEWDEKKALELKKLKNGTFKGTMNLEKDNSYEFRYLIDGTFTNDEGADDYKVNEFGGENAVLNL